MTLMLLDAATLYYRAYYALPDSLVSPRGEPVNAIRGFFDGLRSLRDQYRPNRIVACWDEDWRPQWRVDLLPSYKTHRLADADDIEIRLLEPVEAPLVVDAIRAMGGRRWQDLHKTVYGIALAALLHFFWVKAGKNDFAEVAVYALVILGLLGWRWRRWRIGE